MIIHCLKKTEQHGSHLDPVGKLFNLIGNGSFEIVHRTYLKLLQSGRIP